MNLGIRGKLFAVSVVLIGIVGFSSLAYLEPTLRNWAVSRIESEVATFAESTQAMLESADVATTYTAIDPLADRMGQATGARITVIDTTGQVLGDSSLTVEQVEQTENHANRPEVSPVLAGHGKTISQRYSDAVDKEMLFVAVPWRDGPGLRGVIRAALPLKYVGDVIYRLRLFLGATAIIGLAVAVFMSGLASMLVVRNMQSLFDKARENLRGAGPDQIDDTGLEQRDIDDELQGLGQSVSRLSARLAETFDELARQRDRLGAILESMAEAVVVVDAERQVTLLNEAAENLLDTDERAIGRAITRTIGKPEILDLIDEALEEDADGDMPSAELKLSEQPEQYVVVRATAEPNTGNVVIVLHDVTELRKLERMRRDFVANVSHELRTPISIIRANVDTLQEGALEDPEHAPRFLDSLERTAERMTDLVDDLLDISRLEAGRYEMSLESTNIHDAAERILADVERTVRATDEDEHASPTLRNEVPADLSALADINALDQVLINLLDNATKYTGPSGTVTIEAEQRQEADEVVVRVKDDGPGIPAEDHDRVFERFYRVDSGRSREEGGTGLGLAIVKHLVSTMGGRVGYRANQPEGSVFWFTLPTST